MSTYTPADLGRTGWILVDHTLDGDHWIVEEVLGYRIVSHGPGGRVHRTVDYLTRLPGTGLHHSITSPERLHIEYVPPTDAAHDAGRRRPGRVSMPPAGAPEHQHTKEKP